jgi:hypothetical protein
MLVVVGGLSKKNIHQLSAAFTSSTEATLTKFCREYGEVQDKLRLVRSQVSTAQAEYYQWHSKSEAMASEFYGVEQQLKATNINLGLAKAEFTVITEEIGTTKEELAIFSTPYTRCGSSLQPLRMSLLWFSSTPPQPRLP